MTPGPQERPAKERFEEKFRKGPKDKCWHWTARLSEYGYGVFKLKVGGKWRTRPAHRIAYELYVGKIREGMQIDHLCRNRDCVNPTHLEMVTPAENTRRALVGRKGYNSEKTHCPHGHPYSGDNLYVNPSSGARACRQCKKDARKKWRATLPGYGKGNKDKTHCPQGHEYTPENTYFSKHGRLCRKCKREHYRRWYEKNGKKVARDWYERNKERVKAYNRKYHKERAMG